jgi:hypothetical protein
MNTNQYGFTPKKGTIDSAMEVKVFVKKGLATGEVTVLVSSDVTGAFDAARWPSILNGLRACGCLKTHTTQQKVTLASAQRSWQLTAFDWREI